jgi:hypothetical protein
MTIRFTQQNCKVETTYTQHPDGALTEHVTLSVDPTCPLSLLIEEQAGRPVPQLPARGSSRVRATRYGFEVVPERR